MVVYGVLEPIFKSQKKLIRLSFFKRCRELISDMFYRHKILTVYELFLRNLLKHFLKKCNKMHNFAFLTNLVHRSWETDYSTRRANKIVFKTTVAKSTMAKFSLECRLPKMRNYLSEHNVLPSNYDKLSPGQLNKCVKEITLAFIIQNEPFVKFMSQ